MAETQPPIRTAYATWDGLEAGELAGIKSAVRDIFNAKKDIQKMRQLKMSPKEEERELMEEITKLKEITREWARRPKPSTTRYELADEDRTQFRKLYILVQEGLQNPIIAKCSDFVEQLRELSTLRKAIRATDSVEVEDPVAGRSELGGEIIWQNDREMTRQEASRIVFSPAPEFHEVAEEEGERSTEQEFEEFQISDLDFNSNEEDGEEESWMNDWFDQNSQEH